MLGEDTSMSAIYNVMPDLVPETIGWGAYGDEPDTYLFLCIFRSMTGNVPGASGDPKEQLQHIHSFTAKIAHLHKTVISPSSGKFGSPVPTYGERLHRDTTQCDTWEESFTCGIQKMFDLEQTQQGHNSEMQNLRTAIVDKVIPRLLRPLEIGSRSVVLCLFYSDLWDGNTGVDAVTGQPIIFDACSSYAHHEYELAPWRMERHKINRVYVTEYLKHFGASEPAEEFEDRNALYCM